MEKSKTQRYCGDGTARPGHRCMWDVRKRNTLNVTTAFSLEVTLTLPLTKTGNEAGEACLGREEGQFNKLNLQDLWDNFETSLLDSWEHKC